MSADEFAPALTSGTEDYGPTPEDSLHRSLDAALAKRPRIVCLCGSTRFYDAFQQANYDLTMRGEIVLSVGFYPHSKAEHGHGEGVGHDSVEKVALDELHKRKIDLADYVLVLDVDDYIGDSTRSEIAYAEAHGKPVTYLSEGGGRVAEESEPYRVSPAPQGDAGSRERLDPLAATTLAKPAPAESPGPDGDGIAAGVGGGRHRVTKTHTALYSPPRTLRKRRKCSGHLSAPHWIEVGAQAIWSSLPPDSEIGNEGWWHAVFCMDCAPAECVTPPTDPEGAS